MNKEKERSDFLSDETDDFMLDWITWSPGKNFSAQNTVYHYYKGEDVQRVFTRDKIVFRMAEAATFDDKMEGKAAEIYYDLALEELLNEGKLSENDFFQLSNIGVPKTALYMYPKTKDCYCSKNEESQEYIICFSAEKDSRYMFDHYVKGDSGYCVEFYTLELEELQNVSMDNHARITLLPVLYGKEVVEHLKEKILEIVSKPQRKKHAKTYIETLLHYIQFSAKRSKYAKEKEIRLVVMLPKKSKKTLPNISFPPKENNKKFIFFEATRNIYRNISPDPRNALEKNKTMNEFLRSNNYSEMETV